MLIKPLIGHAMIEAKAYTDNEKKLARNLNLFRFFNNALICAIFFFVRHF